MTEDEIKWLDFEKAVEETLDALFKARFPHFSQYHSSCGHILITLWGTYRPSKQCSHKFSGE